ncbi:MAG: bifunctional phosphopantothenoylcysteine decarboxylase/phosphopantothenate--cysteine ligase CoaBC [Zetaproteobacteria bacterium]|nr:MAG: bifunctional phosphopantothenoylcysteine decarboxylase/phosphopantothenate--cysteine ligase CoaBC [Zetaproteobacteria bacterium]
MLRDKRILLGVGGGIAAYRAAELARLLKHEGAQVRCVLTRAAQRFVAPLTFEALTGTSAHTDLFDLTREREMGHIRLAREADMLLVAPATAHLMARFAHGLADDLLSTIFLAADNLPVLLAPAMNRAMWQAEATQRNRQCLAAQGVHFVGPECGALACGEEGEGRMSEPVRILAHARLLCADKPLLGQRWLVNAGRTEEPWDDVRTLSNRASGRLGLYLAEEAVVAGAEVTFVAGPGVPSSPLPMRRIDVCTARQMHAVCCAQASDCDVFVATAAVSDYRVASPVRGKLKRKGGGETVTLELVENPDIVADVARMPQRPGKVIACAAERAHHLQHAQRKRTAKRVDAIFVNDAARMGDVRGGGWWLSAGGVVELSEMDKRALAARLIELIRRMEEEHDAS